MSQAFRILNDRISQNRSFSPDVIINFAIKSNADGISYTYSEPTIFFEYARDIILQCRQTDGCESMYHTFVSNGYFSKQLLDIIVTEKLLDAINIDLKFIRNNKYRTICGAALKPVIESIKYLSKNSSIHLEIINLVIPDENDDYDDIKKLSETLAAISVEIPLHFSRFYPQFKMSRKPQTSLETLLKAKEIATDCGIKYVYIGNTRLPDALNIYCPECKRLLVDRSSFGVNKIYLNKNSNSNQTICPFCKCYINIIL
jgi:pyruvate formate lyase activating enzyme